METAFAGPAKIRDRLGSLDAAAIASADPEKLLAVFKESPAVHRFPGRWPTARASCAPRSSPTGWGRRAHLDRR